MLKPKLGCEAMHKQQTSDTRRLKWSKYFSSNLLKLRGFLKASVARKSFSKNCHTMRRLFGLPFMTKSAWCTQAAGLRQGQESTGVHIRKQTALQIQTSSLAVSSRSCSSSRRQTRVPGEINENPQQEDAGNALCVRGVTDRKNYVAEERERVRGQSTAVSTS